VISFRVFFYLLFILRVSFIFFNLKFYLRSASKEARATANAGGPIQLTD